MVTVPLININLFIRIAVMCEWWRGAFVEESGACAHRPTVSSHLSLLLAITHLIETLRELITLTNGAPRRHFLKFHTPACEMPVSAGGEIDNFWNWSGSKLCLFEIWIFWLWNDSNLLGIVGFYDQYGCPMWLCVDRQVTSVSSQDHWCYYYIHKLYAWSYSTIEDDFLKELVAHCILAILVHWRRVNRSQERRTRSITAMI